MTRATCENKSGGARNKPDDAPLSAELKYARFVLPPNNVHVIIERRVTQGFQVRVAPEKKIAKIIPVSIPEINSARAYEPFRGSR